MSETKVVAIPTHVKPSVDKDGRRRPAHISTRHRAVPVSEETDGGAENATPLDGFIAKHGGAAHLRVSLEGMTADQRAKLLDAMAHVDGTDPAAVMKKLGIHEPEASEDQAAVDGVLAEIRAKLKEARDAVVITADEYALVVDVYETEGLEVAIKKLQTLREPAQTPLPEEHGVALTAAEEGAAGTRAALQAQADAIFDQHEKSQNQANRADFEIEKRELRRWKIPEQMRTDAAQFHADAARYLEMWQTFCHEHGLESALS